MLPRFVSVSWSSANERQIMIDRMQDSRTALDRIQRMQDAYIVRHERFETMPTTLGARGIKEVLSKWNADAELADSHSQFNHSLLRRHPPTES